MSTILALKPTYTHEKIAVNDINVVFDHISIMILSQSAPDLNTAVCKTSLNLQRPNLSTEAYPICKIKKGWGMGEVTRVRQYG